jgi:hypothetical protein
MAAQAKEEEKGTKIAASLQVDKACKPGPDPQHTRKRGRRAQSSGQPPRALHNVRERRDSNPRSSA